MSILFYLSWIFRHEIHHDDLFAEQINRVELKKNDASALICSGRAVSRKGKAGKVWEKWPNYVNLARLTVEKAKIEWILQTLAIQVVGAAVTQPFFSSPESGQIKFICWTC